MNIMEIMGVAIVFVALASSSAEKIFHNGENVTLTCPRLRSTNPIDAVRGFTYFPALRREITRMPQKFIRITRPDPYSQNGEAAYCPGLRPAYSDVRCQLFRNKTSAENVGTEAVRFTYNVDWGDSSITLRCDAPYNFEAPYNYTDLESVSIRVEYRGEAKINGIAAIIDGRVQSDSDVIKMDLGEDRRGNITLRCVATPSDATITWKLKGKGSTKYAVLPVDTIPTDFVPGAHTTGGDLIFHVTDEDNGEMVECEIRTFDDYATGLRHTKTLSLAYPAIVSDIRASGSYRYWKFTATASGNPTFKGLSTSGSWKLEVVHEKNIIKSLPGRLKNRYTRTFEFVIDQQYEDKNLTLQLVRSIHGLTTVDWMEQFRVSDYYVLPNGCTSILSFKGIIFSTVLPLGSLLFFKLL